MNQLFEDIFLKLKPVYTVYLQEHPSSFDCVINNPDEYYLNTRHIMPNKKPLYFGSVNVQKNYVSFHTIPVYVFPELLNAITPELRHRMQGKSCFNFKKVQPDLFGQLSDLVASGFEAYKKAGYIK